jgi:hypothetical protein
MHLVASHKPLSPAIYHRLDIPVYVGIVAGA